MHLKINNVNTIELAADYIGVSLYENLCYAQRFCRQHDLPEVDLNYGGYLFNIEPGSDLREKEKMYMEYLRL
jgi:hypothetical protein